MKLFKNKHFTKRDYEATNVVYCFAETAPNDNWIECVNDELTGTSAQRLYIQGNVEYWGWL